MAKGTGVQRQTACESRQRIREQNWRKHLDAWRGSGLSQAAYCRREGLSPTDFSCWKHELARRDEVSSPRNSPRSTAFVPIKLTTAGAADVCACEVVLQNGLRLRIGSGVAASRVAELAAALDSRPC